MKAWKILKFPLFDSTPDGEGKELIQIQMPWGAQILEARAQFEIPRLWALCDTSKPTVTRCFRIYATGKEIPHFPGTYIGTFHLKGGSLVAHLFEILPES